MVNRIFLLIIILIPSLSYASDDCYQNKFLGEILKCKQDLYREHESSSNAVYSVIIKNKVSGSLKKQIIENQKIWFESVSKDCAMYSFYVEKGTTTHEIMRLECMTDKYINRQVFLRKIKDNIDDFE